MRNSLPFGSASWYVDGTKGEICMSDAALKNAEAKRDDLAAKINAALHHIEEWKRELRSAEQFIMAWYEYAGVEPATSPLKSATMSKPLQTTPKNPHRDTIRRVVREILDEKKAPIGRTELFNTLKHKGIEIFGKDPEMVLSTMIWRMQDEFVRIPKWGYWFRGRSFEPAGYDPFIPFPGDEEHSEMVRREINGTLPDFDE